MFRFHKASYERAALLAIRLAVTTLIATSAAIEAVSYSHDATQRAGDGDNRGHEQQHDAETPPAGPAH